MYESKLYDILKTKSRIQKELNKRTNYKYIKQNSKRQIISKQNQMHTYKI